SVTTVSPVWSQGLSAPVLGDPVATITDALSDKTVTKLDSSGRPVYQRAADSGVTTWTRDSAGRGSTGTDALSRTTDHLRDGPGFVTETILPDNSTQLYTYQASFHAMTSSTDERGNTTTYSYDGSGHRITMKDALNEVTTYAFDSGTGLLTTITDPLGHITTLAYDANRRLSTSADYLGTTSYTYDSLTGETATVADPLNRVTTSLYNAVAQATEVIYPDGNPEYSTYNNSGLLATHTDKTGVQD